MSTTKQWERDLSKSNDLFMSKVAPILEDKFDISIYQIEGDDNPILKLLDTNSGIDYLAKTKDGGLLGLASRVQYLRGRPFNTFTIRKSRASGAKTEYEKRKEDIELGRFYPRFTIQAYVNKDTLELISFAMAETSDLINYIDKGRAKVLTTGSNQVGQAEFYVIPWRDLQGLSTVNIFKPKEYEYKN